MVHAITLIVCRCTVAGNRIVFCLCTSRTDSLLRACEYLRQMLMTIKPANAGEEVFIKQVVLPYANDAIARALQGQRGIMLKGDRKPPI